MAVGAALRKIMRYVAFRVGLSSKSKLLFVTIE